MRSWRSRSGVPQIRSRKVRIAARVEVFEIGTRRCAIFFDGEVSPRRPKRTRRSPAGLGLFGTARAESRIRLCDREAQATAGPGKKSWVRYRSANELQRAAKKITKSRRTHSAPRQILRPASLQNIQPQPVREVFQFREVLVFVPRPTVRRVLLHLVGVNGGRKTGAARRWQDHADVVFGCKPPWI